MSNPIVAEEQELLLRVTSLLKGVTHPVEPNEAPIVQELEDIREQLLSGSDNKDAAALTQRWNQQSALLAQLRSARGAARVDPGSPYFAHLRIRENGRERDLCIGRATCIESGLRIVDWRNAPISKIFYRYQQGEEYEETLGDRVHSGVVLARRTVNIRESRLERVESPEGIFVADATRSDGWIRSEREKPALAGGEASALRAREPDDRSPQLGTPGHTGRADKRLPEITSLIDPEQFELITRPSMGFLAIRGRPVRARRPSRFIGLPTSPSTIPKWILQERSSPYSLRHSEITWGTCFPRSGLGTSRSRPFTIGWPNKGGVISHNYHVRSEKTPRLSFSA